MCVKRTASFLIVGFALMLGACKTSRPAQIGTQAPDFTVNDGEKSVTLSQYRGKPVVLNFWATWCAPCIQEIPSMVRLQQQLGDKVVILAVSTDVDAGAYKNFTTKNMPGMLTVRDGDHRSNALYGTFAFPETYVIDRKGVIQRKFIGAVEWTSPEIVDYLSKM
jgi:cytochrome c biogenesis protein CcmG, thiol:disulfide interchange protein DsbE